VGWHFITPLATVQFGTPKRVDRETLVRVDGHAEETRVSINQLDVITLSKVMKDAGFVEECEIGHVFNLLELGWIHLAYHIFPHSLLLLT